MRESGRQFFPNLFPRHRLHFSRVYVLNAPGDLFLPGLLGPFFHRAVEAGEQGIGQGRPLLFGERKRLLEQVKGLLRHTMIIPPESRRGNLSSPISTFCLLVCNFPIYLLACAKKRKKLTMKRTVRRRSCC